MSELSTLSRPTAADKFPQKGDWELLQGGEPRVFYDPQNPHGKAWQVVHVYDNAERRFINGSILPTMPPKRSTVEFTDISLDTPPDAKIPSRVVRAPRMMIYRLHGEPCEHRSGNHAGAAYDRIKTETEYDDYIRNLAKAGLWELAYILVDEKPMLMPKPIHLP